MVMGRIWSYRIGRMDASLFDSIRGVWWCIFQHYSRENEHPSRWIGWFIPLSRYVQFGSNRIGSSPIAHKHTYRSNESKPATPQHTAHSHPIILSHIFVIEINDTRHAIFCSVHLCVYYYWTTTFSHTKYCFQSFSSSQQNNNKTNKKQTNE